MVAVAKAKKRLLAQHFCPLNMQSKKSFTVIMEEKLKKKETNKKGNAVCTDTVTT